MKTTNDAGHNGPHTLTPAPMTKAFALPKKERINSKKQIDRLFAGRGSRAMSAFPLRLVYMEEERGGEGSLPVQMMVSVPKRHFKHAVERNRVKRLVREAYRRHRHILAEAVERAGGRQLRLAFIWTAAEMRTYGEVEQRVVNLLQRLGERQ